MPAWTLNDRRRLPRGPLGEPPRLRLVRIIEGTYRELPGLDLALTQAARLFGLRESTCRVVLDDLVRGAILCRSENGRYLAGPGIDNA